LIKVTGDEQLQQVFRSLKGKEGKAAARKGLRAAAKIVQKALKQQLPKVSGALRKSVRVRAMKRSRKGVGVMVQVYATRKDKPYSLFLEVGVKQQPKGVRVRKKQKRITVNGLKKRVTDEERSTAYNALAWRVKPRHYSRDAMKEWQALALEACLQAVRAELERLAQKPGAGK